MKKLVGEFDPDAGLHTLRHSFLTEAGRYSKNIRALQLLAGHANIQTTMKYVHPDAADAAEIAAQVQAAREARTLAGTPKVPTEVPTVQ